MRDVAVTEGDKVEAQRRLGYSVNGYGVGDVVKYVNDVDGAEVDNLIREYEDRYHLVPELQEGGERREQLRHGARQEIGIRRFLEEHHDE